MWSSGTVHSRVYVRGKEGVLLHSYLVFLPSENRRKKERNTSEAFPIFGKLKLIILMVAVLQ